VDHLSLRVIGTVKSSLLNLEEAPRQADEGTFSAWLVFDAEVAEGLQGLRVGDEVVILTWLHHADRNLLQVHPRGDEARALSGVFATRSPHRPNPIGLHQAKIKSIDGSNIEVDHLEALHGTPILDLKPVLSADITNR